MALCPLCSERSAKRLCPAKSTRICPVCCGTKREVEIDCPGDCPHLVSGRAYEAEKRLPDPELAAAAGRFDDDFLRRHSATLDAMSQTVVEERRSSPELVDNDVVETYKSLGKTMKTLDGGIYYESLPDGHVRIALFNRLRGLLDQLMQPQADAARRALRTSEAVQVLDFLTLAAMSNASGRPRSRQYLDWLTKVAGEEPVAEPSSRLILP